MRMSELLGRHRSELPTPALLLDLDVARRNARVIGQALDGLPATLRAHVKTHKSPDLARLQVQWGARGICAATAWEALAMSQAGLQDILVANQVVEAGAMDALVGAAASSKVSVAVDATGNVAELGRAAQAAAVRLGVLVEVDIGMARCGVRSPEHAVAVADAVGDWESLELQGLMGYEGHCMGEPDLALRAARAAEARRVLLAAADAVLGRGLPCSVISAGGTGTYAVTGADPRVTEIQAGSYICMDVFHRQMTPEFDCAMTVLASVLSVRRDVTVLNVGRKSVGIDLALPRLLSNDAEVTFVNEEHMGVALPEARSGQRVEVIPGYAPTTANLYDAMFVLEDDRVSDIWPVVARYGLSTTGAQHSRPLRANV
jgi:D-serine deaminase-like pyridoxal phosphate-dependent protein